jgi:hypothetical protein
MYKLINDIITNQTDGVRRLSDMACIPFAPDNTDYQRFKKDIQNGAVLNDADGNAITGTELTTFISTLP